jgi:repressor LexA
MLSSELIGGDSSFVLRVHGDSMTGAGILDGDMVVVKPAKDAPNGTIVVARVESEATHESEVTVKRLFKEAHRIRLEAENPSYPPIHAKQAELEGVVVAVLRVMR